MRLSLKMYAPILVVPLLLAVGCNKDDANASKETTAAVPTAADNTKVNERDKGSSTTPTDQGNNAADLNTTQQIRKALMADDSLSSDAKNAKVITANGTVTLRGPVKSETERKNVEAKALQLAGGNRVDNRIDIEATK